MTTIEIDQVSELLPELLNRLPHRSRPCKAGSLQKPEFWMAPDFEAPLDDFNEQINELTNDRTGIAITNGCVLVSICHAPKIR